MKPHSASSPRLVATLLAASAAIVAAPAASAALIAYEGFDYSAGSSNLGGLNGGTGWAAGWDGDNNGNGTLGAGLTFGDLTTSGGAYTIRSSFDNANTLPFRELTTPVTTGTVWISFLSSGFGTAGSQFHALVLSPDVSAEVQEGFSIGETWGLGTRSIYGNNVGAEHSSGVTSAGVGFNVVSINLTTGSFTYWVNPTLGGENPTGGTSITATHTLPSIDGIALRGSEAIVFDEIRIGTSFADVAPTAVPEPSSAAALAGAAMLGLAALRRRRA